MPDETMDIESLGLSDEPQPDVAAVAEHWHEPAEFPPLPPAGKYYGSLAGLRIDQWSETFEPQLGRKILNAVVDLEIQDGSEHSGKRINFVRLSNRPRRSDRQSSIMDIVKSAGLEFPQGNAAQARTLKHMAETKAKFGFQLDWRGFCTTCYENHLKSVTGSDDPAVAKAQSSDQQKRAAASHATRARNYRAFPDALNGAPGKRDGFVCPGCQNEIRAQAQIQRFLAPRSGDEIPF